MVVMYLFLQPGKDSSIYGPSSVELKSQQMTLTHSGYKYF
jgi:hypothetical protein